MSEIKPDASVNRDDELKSLLEEWRAPAAPASLDKRVTAAYRRQITEAFGASNPLFAQPYSEVVKMKQCPTCHEEFADKFSFCPVDGTPLAAAQAARAVKPEPSLTQPTIPAFSSHEESYAAAAAESQALVPVDDSYHLTILDDAGLLSRLTSELREVAHESQLTWPEFKRDPLGFLKRSITSYAGLLGRFVSQPGVGPAMAVAVGSMVLLMLGVILLERTRSAGATRAVMIGFGLVAVGMLVAIFASWFSRDTEASVGVARSGAAMAGGTRSDSNNALAGMIAAFVFIFLVVGGVIGWNFYSNWKHQRDLAQDRVRDDLELISNDVNIPEQQESPKPGAAGLNKGSGGGSKPQYERPHGGGGGGQQEQLPASHGKVPPGSLDIPQVLPPDPHPPKIPNPSLPTPVTLNVDPLLDPLDARRMPFGLPNSTATTPSAGPGSGHGIGTGSGTGVGQGEGNGLGPGRGGNTGGGDYGPGGGGPGGGGEGGPDRIYSTREVTVKAKITYKPEAQYTEEARRNQITGTVVLRAVLASNGTITGIKAVNTLPNGLTEQAIAAARKIKFVPAQRDGRAVSQYIQIEYNFNLY